jgi:hypothetical protein
VNDRGLTNAGVSEKENFAGGFVERGH